MRSTLLKLLLQLCGYLPLTVCHLLGGVAGRLLLLPNTQRRVAQINIQHCFPQLDDQQQQQLLRRSLIETSKTLFETGRLWLGPKQRFSSLIGQVSGEAIINTAREQGRGVIVALPHLGSWEVVGLYCSSRYPTTSLYRPPRMAQLERTVRHARERFGATLVPTDARGVRALHKALKRNELTMILPDQDPRDGAGEFAPFCGIEAKTMTLLSRLAQKSGARVVLAYGERLPHGRGFHIHFIQAPDRFYSRDLKQSVTALNQLITAAIEELPQQYQWGYKRFRSRPEGAEPLY